MTENTNKTNLELNKDLLTNVNGNATSFIEYKQGYVMRKCCVGPTGKKSKLFLFQNWLYSSKCGVLRLKFNFISVAGRWCSVRYVT